MANQHIPSSFSISLRDDFPYGVQIFSTTHWQLKLISWLSWKSFEGTWAWYHFCIGGTDVQFILPHKTPMLYLSLCFCTWYHAANAITDFHINDDYLKEIENYYSKNNKLKRTRDNGIEEFLNIKDDDEAEDEVGATRVREEAAARD